MGLIAETLKRKWLDVSFQTGGQRVDIFERPGRWMSSDRLRRLQSDMEAVAISSLEAGKLDYGVFAEETSAFDNTIVTLVRRLDDDRPIAFNALSLMDISAFGADCRVVHLGLVMVDANERNKGLSWILYGLTCLLIFVRGGMRPTYVSNVTQVPAVVGMVSETFSEVCPTPSDSKPKDFRKILIAREIMANHRHVFGVGDDATFEEQRFIIRNAYTGGSDDLMKTFEDAPQHRDAQYNDWCAKMLNYDRGDDFLQIGVIDLYAAQRYVTRTVPRKSILQVAVLGALVVMRRALLPVFHWFDTKTDFGRIRAR